jgi:hypothetical protein
MVRMLHGRVMPAPGFHGANTQVRPFPLASGKIVMH